MIDITSTVLSNLGLTLTSTAFMAFGLILVLYDLIYKRRTVLPHYHTQLNQVSVKDVLKPLVTRISKESHYQGFTITAKSQASKKLISLKRCKILSGTLQWKRISYATIQRKHIIVAE